MKCCVIEARRKFLQTEKLTLKIARDTLSMFEAVQETKKVAVNEMHFAKPKCNVVTSVKQSHRSTKSMRCGGNSCRVRLWERPAITVKS